MSNPGQIALGIVGGVVGAFIGGPTGAAYGLQIGLAVGNVVSPTQLPGTFGPRLNDKRTTTAQLGSPITEVFGTDVVAGTVIWLGEVIEHAHTEEVGGKGGPEGENTTFSYTQSIAVGLCRGPMAGLLRVWENGKLVYDVREQQPGESTGDYSMRLAAGVEYASTFTLYLGGELQMPDPTLELKEGVGNVPAFRGLMYIVYPDRSLKDDQAQRHPSFKFEVSGIEAIEAGRRLVMVTDAPGIETDPYSLVAFPTTLADPQVVQFEDTYNDSQVHGRDCCGMGDTLFAVGRISETQYWARISFDAGLTWESRLVDPQLAVEPELPTQLGAGSCAMGATGRIVCSGTRDPGAAEDLVFSDTLNGNSWGQCFTLGVEFDFRFGVVRYIEELDVWLCGGYRGIAKSADGIVWSSVVSGESSFNPLHFAYGDGAIAALRSGAIEASTDGGDTWTTVFTDGFSQRAIAFGNGVWVRFDNGIFGVFDPGFSVATDLAGPWSPLAGPVGWSIRDMLFDGSQFIAVGSNASAESLIGVSPDGIEWTLASEADVAAGGAIRRIAQVFP